MLLGSSDKFKISSDDKINSWSNSSPFTIFGVAPTAQIILAHSKISPFALITFLSTISASVITVLTLAFFSASSIPLRN